VTTLTTHIHTRPRPDQDAHELSETCWCHPALTRYTPSKFSNDLPEHLIVDHDGQVAASVEAEIRGRIVNPVLAALDTICATVVEVEQARNRRAEVARLRNHHCFHTDRGLTNPACGHCQPVAVAAGGAA
jgi:hypothetical protein